MEEVKCANDEELVKAFRGGDKLSGEELLTRYKNKVLAIARRFFLAGGDTEDLVQEGMCGLYSAMTSFEGGSEFYPYAYSCIKNRILDAVKRSGNSKNQALNGFAPFSDDDSAGYGFSPEEALIDDENRSEFAHAMKSELSPLEYRVICLYVEGATLGEISSALDITYKQTDNAIARAKLKLRRIYDK